MKTINGKNINLRTVEFTDAEFIYSMRQNEIKTKYLTKTNGTLEDQREWIKHYKERENKNFISSLNQKMLTSSDW